MNYRLYIIAGTFLLFVVSVVIFIATASKARKRRTNQAYPSSEPPSRKRLMLPMDTSLEGLELRVSDDAPSASLLIPLRTGEWMPPEEPAPADALGQVSLAERMQEYKPIPEIREPSYSPGGYPAWQAGPAVPVGGQQERPSEEPGLTPQQPDSAPSPAPVPRPEPVSAQGPAPGTYPGPQPYAQQPYPQPYPEEQAYGQPMQPPYGQPMPPGYPQPYPQFYPQPYPQPYPQQPYPEQPPYGQPMQPPYPQPQPYGQPMPPGYPQPVQAYPQQPYVEPVGEAPSPVPPPAQPADAPNLESPSMGEAPEQADGRDSSAVADLPVQPTSDDATVVSEPGEMASESAGAERESGLLEAIPAAEPTWAARVPEVAVEPLMVEVQPPAPVPAVGDFDLTAQIAALALEPEVPASSGIQETTELDAEVELDALVESLRESEKQEPAPESAPSITVPAEKVIEEAARDEVAATATAEPVLSAPVEPASLLLPSEPTPVAPEPPTVPAPVVPVPTPAPVVLEPSPSPEPEMVAAAPAAPEPQEEPAPEPPVEPPAIVVPAAAQSAEPAARAPEVLEPQWVDMMREQQGAKAPARPPLRPTAVAPQASPRPAAVVNAPPVASSQSGAAPSPPARRARPEVRVHRTEAGEASDRPGTRRIAPLRPSRPAAGAPEGKRGPVPEITMEAPVEMWFGEKRVGVKAGTATYDRFRKYADVLLEDLKAAADQSR